MRDANGIDVLYYLKGLGATDKVLASVLGCCDRHVRRIFAGECGDKPDIITQAKHILDNVHVRYGDEAVQRIVDYWIEDTKVQSFIQDANKNLSIHYHTQHNAAILGAIANLQQSYSKAISDGDVDDREANELINELNEVLSKAASLRSAIKENLQNKLQKVG